MSTDSSGVPLLSERLREFTDADLDMRIRQNLPGSIIYGQCVEERRRREYEALKKHHWTVTPGFWVSVVAAIFAAIAAWPVIRDWFSLPRPR
jgi:hypothetical protein